MNRHQKVIVVLLALNLVFFGYFFHFNGIVFNNEDFFKEQFIENGVYNKFPDQDIDKINRYTLTYLRDFSDFELINEGFFNEKERTHLLDVKRVFHGFYQFNNVLIYFSILLLIILYFSLYHGSKNKEFYSKGMMEHYAKIFITVLLVGSILTILDVVILLLLVNFKFQFLFNIMHQMLFESGSFVFDPTSNIINLYSLNFFINITKEIVKGVFLSSVITGILSYLGLRFFFEKNYDKAYVKEEIKEGELDKVGDKPRKRRKKKK